MDWSSMGEECFRGLSFIANHLLRLRLNADREGELNNAELDFRHISIHIESFHSIKPIILGKTITCLAILLISIKKIWQCLCHLTEQRKEIAKNAHFLKLYMLDFCI